MAPPGRVRGLVGHAHGRELDQARDEVEQTPDATPNQNAARSPDRHRPPHQVTTAAAPAPASEAPQV